MNTRYLVTYTFQVVESFGWTTPITKTQERIEPEGVTADALKMSHSIKAELERHAKVDWPDHVVGHVKVVDVEALEEVGA